MQLNREPLQAAVLINRYSPGSITVNNTDYQQSLLLDNKTITPLAIEAVSEITPELLETLCAQKPTILLIGTGQQPQFLATALFATVYQARIGLEIMSTRSACHTFNILVNENRAVSALLIR